MISYFKRPPAVKPTLKMWLATLVGGLLNYLSIAIIANSLSQSDFGRLMFVLTLAQVLASLSAFGAPSYWLKIFGKIGYSALVLVPSTIIYWGLTSFCVVVVFLCLGFLLDVPRGSNITFIVLMALIPAQGMLDLASAKLQLEGRLTRLATFQLFPHLLRMSSIYLASALTDILERNVFEAAIGLSSAITLLVCVNEVRKISQPNFSLEAHSRNSSQQLSRHSDTKGPSSIFRSSLPFGTINLLHLVNASSGTLLAFYLLGEEKAALLSPAMMLIFAAYLLPGVLFTKVLGASMHRKFYSDRESLVGEYKELSMRMFFVGLVIASLAYVCYPLVIRLFFSEGYSLSGDLVKILVFSIPLYFAAYAYDILMITGKTIILKVKVMVVLIFLNTTLISIGAVTDGLIGIAYATVAAHLLAFLLYWVLSERVSPAS